MTILLNRSIHALSVVVNTATGITHPIDSSKAKELFIALRRARIPLDFDSVKAIAMGYQWPEEHAIALAELATRIGNGERVVIKVKQDWGNFIVAKIMAELCNA